MSLESNISELTKAITALNVSITSLNIIPVVAQEAKVPQEEDTEETTPSVKKTRKSKKPKGEAQEDTQASQEADPKDTQITVDDVVASLKKLATLTDRKAAFAILKSHGGVAAMADLPEAKYEHVHIAANKAILTASGDGF